MWSLLWPVLLLVSANTVYQITAKSVPGGINPYASLLVTYLLAAAASLVMFWCTAGGQSLSSQVRQINWASWLLGIAVVGLETGSIFLYRAGWDIHTGPLVASIALAVVLIFVGALFYKESVSVKQLLGIALCLGGLVLVNLK